jgi:hypothetical protein
MVLLPGTHTAVLVQRTCSLPGGGRPQVLAQHFGGVGGQHFTSEGGPEGELFPYVSFTLNLEEQ